MSIATPNQGALRLSTSYTDWQSKVMASQNVNPAHPRLHLGKCILAALFGVPAVTVLMTATHAADAAPAASENAASSTTLSAVPSRSDALAAGDYIKLRVDAPIFQYIPKPSPNNDQTNASIGSDRNSAGSTAAESSTKRYACAPAGSIFEIIQAPTATTTTVVTPAVAKNQNSADGSASATGGGAALAQDPVAPNTTVSANHSRTTVSTKAASSGDQTTTTTETLATASIIRVGDSRFSPGLAKTRCTSASDPNSPLPGFDTVVPRGTYQFSTADLDTIKNHRFGWTYGGLVVPNKIQISDRSFSSSTSVFPYVGYENWGTGISGTAVLAAGLGTAPASSQTPAANGKQAAGSSSTSSSTKAVFSAAVGEIWQFGSTFKLGILLGVDTAGSNTGYKYQGKPWIGITLGAGT